MKLLFEVSGVVHAPLERVRERMFAYWGGWWYRGEDSLHPHPEGALLVHRVHNIAKQGNWAPYLANKLFIGYRARLEDGLRQRVAQLEDPA